MGFNRLLRVCALTLAFTIVPEAPALAQGSRSDATIRLLQDKLADFDIEEKRLTRELEFARSKRQTTEHKLQGTERELKNKEADMQRLRISLGANPSAAESELLANEQRRIALAELEIKSLMATSVRLERKETELKSALAELEEQARITQQGIADAKERARQQSKAKQEVVKAELAALKRENERLRLAMEEEARRAQEAAAEAQRLAELAEKQEQERLAQEALAAERAAAREAEADPSQTALDDEPPVHLGDDGAKVVIRSRSIAAPVTMEPVSPGMFQAEVVVEPGKAYFDVRNRRFRGYFPDADKPSTFVFIYDMSGEKPTFSVMSRDAGSPDPQMISDSHNPF